MLIITRVITITVFVMFLEITIIKNNNNNDANLSLLPGLVGDLDELLDLRYGRASKVLHGYHCVL